ncbi:MAG: CDP-alcohol phosphatidyltransferase family protein [Rhodospirillales bacterium]
MSEPLKVSIFPLIRWFSGRLTPILVALPITPNQISIAGLLFGLSACWLFSLGGYVWSLAGAGLFFVCYVLDFCDGEVARAKNLTSDFGHKLDTFVDWIVHTAFFLGLGIGIEAETGSRVWFWLGVVGGAGASINYFLGLIMDARYKKEQEGSQEQPDTEMKVPENRKQWLAFFLRELSRADFCFIVLILALFGQTWILLPTAAIGAHAYWALQFVRGVRDYHV